MNTIDFVTLYIEMAKATTNDRDKVRLIFKAEELLDQISGTSLVMSADPTNCTAEALYEMHLIAPLDKAV